MFRMRHIKMKYLFLFLFIVILMLTFCKYYYQIDNYTRTNELMSNLKDNFGNDLYLKVNREIKQEYIHKSNENINLFGTYKDTEWLNEIQRRERFNFNRKLKYIYVNNSLPKLLNSFKMKKFVPKKENNIDWQKDMFGPSKPHIIRSTNKQVHLFPEISNGYLGIQGFSDEIHIQSIFTGSGLETRRASIPAWTIRNITGVFDGAGTNLVLGRRLELDMSDAKLLQTIYTNHCIVQQKIYAHQSIKSLLVHEIDIEFLNKSLPFVVLNLPKGRKNDLSLNMQFQPMMSSDARLRSLKGVTHRSDMSYHDQNIYAQHHVIPSEIVITSSSSVKKYYYLLSLNEDKEMADEHFNLGINMMENNNELYRNHGFTWQNIWSSSGIMMKIGDYLDVPLISAQYLVITNSPSFGRDDSIGAIGSAGLGVPTNQVVDFTLQSNANGRIESDQELWMMGYQMFMNPLSVKAMLKKRLKQLIAARRNAIRFSFKGARFPVTTNELGDELCPESICKNVHFPTGMVALALKRYLMITGDMSLFKENSEIKFFKEINSFYLSVLQTNLSSLSKFNSVGPGSSFRVVTNSAFNIGLMKEVLLALPVLVHFLEYPYNAEMAVYMSKLKNISDSIPIPFDLKHRFNPPYDNYFVLNEFVDLPYGVMLRHPLDFLVDIDIGTNNAEYYDKWLVDNPSPMALSTMFIANIEADKFSRAFRRWDQLLEFSDNEFKIWSNKSHNWVGSYVPAAAAYIDTVLYGLFGLKIRKTGLYLKPKLVKDIGMMQLSCLNYLGSKIKVIVDQTHGIFLEILFKQTGARPLGVMNVEHGVSVPLRDNASFPLNSHIVIKRLQ